MAGLVDRAVQPTSARIPGRSLVVEVLGGSESQSRGATATDRGKLDIRLAQWRAWGLHRRWRRAETASAALMLLP